MLRQPEPGSFEHLLSLVPVACGDMVRLSVSGKSEPYWAKRAQYRFDDPSDSSAIPRFGVLYVAPQLGTAFCESVIHENALFHSGVYEVPTDEFDRREVTRFEHPAKKELQLVDLSGDALKRMALNNDISAGNDYTLPQLWSKAIHAACPSADGLLYLSRQRPGRVCYAIFERSGLIMRDWRKLTDLEKSSLCADFNATPV